MLHLPLTDTNCARFIDYVKTSAKKIPTLFEAFESPVVTNVIAVVVSNVLDSNSSQRIGATNILFIGAFPLMKGLAQVLTSLENEADKKKLFIYHNYEDSPKSLLELLKSVPSLVLEDITTLTAALKVLAVKKYELVFFLDEIQNLYVDFGHPCYYFYKDIVSEFRVIAKSVPNAFVVLSSSSPTFRSLAYERKDYPTLNDSVFRPYISH